MKKTDMVELKTKTVDELKRRLADLSDEISKLKTEKALGKLKNTNAISNKKKEIARALTFLSIKMNVVNIQAEGRGEDKS